MNSWPHAPTHRFLESGTYMVTAATYNKLLLFQSPARLKFLHDALLQLTTEYHWNLQAWAVFANHYHFIAQSPDDPKNLSAMISHLHVTTAKHVNAEDNTPNRRVWWQYWDSHITYQYSYLSRLNYVNQNPVRHGIVDDSIIYPWCSANWFQQTALPSFHKTVESFKIDKVNVIDDF